MRKSKTTQKVTWPAPDTVTKMVPVPTDGWDAISPLALMDPKRAPILDNFIPRPGWVELRAGYRPYAYCNTNLPVESLMTWRSATTEKLFAASSTKIFEVTTPSAPTVVQSGLSSARWQYVNFAPAGSPQRNLLQCVNGLDALRQYDNISGWTTPVITFGALSFTTADIVNIAAQKRRLWYIMKNSTIACFMPTDAFQGAIAGSLDLGAVWVKGGFIVAMANWTIDGGNGPQDYAVFISSRGQLTIYAGTDPTNSSTWSLVGTFDVSPPVSYRCLLRVGSDVGIITMQGVLPLSQALPFDPSADRSVSITSRIQNAMASAMTIAQNNFGWQLISFPAQQLAILNVPLTENMNQVQFVMNALNGAWCRFTGWNANCFEIFNESLYFGGNDGYVNLAYESGLDGVSSIIADMQCAFNYFEDPGRTKRMTMVQPLIIASGSLSPTISVDTDFQSSTSVASISLIQGGASWDSAVWDLNTWPEPTVSVTDWLSAQGIGHAMAVRMKINVATPSQITNAEFDLALFDSATFDVGVGDAPILQINAFNAILEFGGFI